MKEVIEAVEELIAKGLIKDYAIGGGIASIYYIEPVFTEDIDIFVAFPDETSRHLIPYL